MVFTADDAPSLSTLDAARQTERADTAYQNLARMPKNTCVPLSYTARTWVVFWA
jgi:hypothetical protein